MLETLVERAETLSTAESLTGGMLAAQVTAVAGASRSFVGGVVSYATDVKQALLGVPPTLLARHTVVSGECAIAMATGVRELLGTTWGVATTGVAGPDEQDGHPVGTVWVAVAGPGGSWSRQLALSGTRSEIRETTCLEAMGLLQGILDREEPGLG